MDLLKKHLNIWQRALKLFMENDALAAAGNMAFLTMLSMFPFVIFLISLSGFLGQTERGLEGIAFMLDVLPPEVSKVIDGPIQGVVKNTGREILTGSILFAIWTAAAVVEAARGVLIKAYGKEYARSIVIRRLESLGVVIFGGIAVIAAMSTLVLGPPLIKAFTSLFPDAATDGINEIWRYLSLLVSPLLLMLGLHFAYFSLTPRRVRKPSHLPGTIFSLLMLFGTAKGLSVYLKYAGNYDVTYGSLAGVVILQLFCFLVSIGFILGGELNAAYTFEKNSIKTPHETEDSDTESEKSESDAV
ncbi:YihY/virulence factor BrkB family protein [Kordiimonas sp. SCSIO 12603]|uniref:YihY/virulence factor BrkB family protein n=1 Tax=Kordiimonas sp. SCSIO 12603 TaxID=2829596 RepID=UPI002107498B|nr:YihY/virulence factor BrkB family protein [Kordiimonas sp. SCSIO 12603]UTW57193.1 YihY/virulence factor BrkB family protein [Kordiimonas sp. SCSIO 12603]